MKIMVMLVVILAAVFASTSFASEEPSEKSLSRGIALIEQGNYTEAATVLREVAGKSPEDPEAAFSLGKALNRMADKEAETHLKKSLMLAPENPGVNLELGILYYNKNVYAEAADYFETTISLDPASEFAGKAREFLKKIDDKGKGSRWEIGFLAGLQYDSNVILNGTGLPLPAGYTGKSDWSGVLNLKGNYSLVKKEQVELTAGYSLYQSLHIRLTDFDITQNLADLSLLYRLSPNMKVKASYAFEYLLLDGDNYDHAHILAPAIQFKLGDWGATTVDYRYRNTSYRNSDKFTNNSDRNGDNHQAGINHVLPLGKSLAVWAAYAHDEEMTRKTFWDYRGDRWLAGFRSDLPLNIIADIYGEYYQKRYGADDPSFGATRNDRLYSASMSLTKHFSDKLSLVLGELYTRNRSNIGVFDYERVITSLFMNVRFYE